MNLTRTWPLFVRASLGSIRPIVVVNETSVPFCTGVPAPALVVVVVVGGVVVVPGVVVPGVVVGVDGAEATPFSITFATISISLLSGTVLEVENSVITEPVGASSGTLSHASAQKRIVMATRPATNVVRRLVCATINNAKDNTLMCLEGGQGGQRGYAMAALLVGIGVMMLLMSVAMPVWRTQAQREKEAELVFRGEQIARAINLYMRKAGGGNYPPSLDVLVQGRFLRKKYKDPMTESGEWDLITAASGLSGPAGSQQPGRGGRTGAPSTGLSAPPSGRASAPSPFSGSAGTAGGIMGVRSKSKETSFRLYKGGGTHYNEWPFLFSSVSNRPGFPGQVPGQSAPGQRGRGQFPGQNPTGRNPGGNTQTITPGGNSIGSPVVRAPAGSSAVSAAGAAAEADRLTVI